MAGMPKQGYKNLVLAGWVPDPALGLGGGRTRHRGSALPAGGPWGGLGAAGWWPWGHPSGHCRDGGRGRRSWRKKKNQKGRRKGKACLTQRRNLIRAELYSPAKDIGYFRDIGKK